MKFSIKLLTIVTTLAFSIAVSAQDAPVQYEGDFKPGKTIPPAGAIAKTWGEIVYGSADAPVEIIEYASLMCPHCGTFANEIFPQIKAKYIDTGKVRFVFRNMVSNRNDLLVTTVARCGTEEQSKEVIASFFEHQERWMRAQDPLMALSSLAVRHGVSFEEFSACMDDIYMRKHLVAMAQYGQRVYQVQRTPTVIINGMPQTNYSFENISNLVDEALK